MEGILRTIRELVDLQAFLGAFYGDGCVSYPGKNARFYFSQNDGNQGGYDHTKQIYELLKPILARRFLLLGGPQVIKRRQKGSLLTTYLLESRCHPMWSLFHSLVYVNGDKTLPASVAEILDEVFIAYLLMGDGHWAGSNGIKICTNSFLPECLERLQGVLLRHGITTVQRSDGVMKSGRMGYLLFVRSADTKSIQRVQDIARRHFCPGMMYRAGLKPDGSLLGAK